MGGLFRCKWLGGFKGPGDCRGVLRWQVGWGMDWRGVLRRRSFCNWAAKVQCDDRWEYAAAGELQPTFYLTNPFTSTLLV